LDSGQQEDRQKEEGEGVLFDEPLHRSVVSQPDNREVGDAADQDHRPDERHRPHD
jgi:hypothetical protein